MAEEDLNQAKDFELNLLNTFLESEFSRKASKGLAKDYMNSLVRSEKYKKAAGDDETFLELIQKKYGTLENFLLFNQTLSENRIFDPVSDYEIQVEIITEDQFLKSNFISSQEVYLEILDGVATVQYFKKDGNIAQVTGTLKKSFIPSSEHETRMGALGGFGGNRVLMWDIQKQGWSSFYLPNVRRFVRDDTTGLE
jgi:hypothetical protein